MRGFLGLGASGLAGLAAVVASLDGDADIVPFFVGLTFIGAVTAWGAHWPYVGSRRWLVRGAALVWLVAAIWVGALLLMYQLVWQASGPPPGVEHTYLGITATVYHLVGLYGGLACALVCAFGRTAWFERST